MRRNLRENKALRECDQNEEEPIHAWMSGNAGLAPQGRDGEARGFEETKWSSQTALRRQSRLTVSLAWANVRTSEGAVRRGQLPATQVCF